MPAKRGRHVLQANILETTALSLLEDLAESSSPFF